MKSNSTEPARDSDEPGVSSTEAPIPLPGTPEHDMWVHRIVDPILSATPVAPPTLTEKVEVFAAVITALRRAKQSWPVIAVALEAHGIKASADVLRVMYGRIEKRRRNVKPPLRTAPLPSQAAGSAKVGVGPQRGPGPTPSDTRPNLARRIR